MVKSLQQKLEQLQQKAFVPYIMAGDGGLDQTIKQIHFLQAQGATAIEVGIPFSDPVADGPIIQAAGMRALGAGANLKNIIEKLIEEKDSIHVPLIFMSYLNPFLAYGLDQFVIDAEQANVKGLIIPDMPVEESDLITPFLKNTDIALIQLVSLTSPTARIKKITSHAEGFVYAVMVNGVTGGRTTYKENIQQHLCTLKQLSPIPVLAGFGISTREQVIDMGQNVDGVIVGSTIVNAFHNNDLASISALMQQNEITA